MNRIIKSKSLFLILILVSFVITTQYYLLYDSLFFGFKPDDWILYLSYKALGSNPLFQLPAVWGERGLYTTYQVYYMGLLDSLFGLNYYEFHLANLILKIIATIGLYPLILLVFKKRLLAYLTVILFSISHSAVGSLEFVVKGSDYLAIIFMEIFLLIYYFFISSKLSGRRYYTLLSVFFILAFISSPIRMFPLLLIPVMTETFLILKYRRSNVFKNSLKRLIVLYSPFIAAFVFLNRKSLTGDAYGPIGILKEVLEGNLYLILSPFSGVGYLFITNDYWRKLFGLISTEDFNHYLIFLLGGPTVIHGLITALISWSLIARRKVFFFFFITILNFIFQIAIFFITAYNLRINPNINNDITILYSVIFGGFILIVGFTVFLLWLIEKDQDRLLASFWAGSVLLLVFTFLTWAFAPMGTRFSSTSYYLVVASIGSSLMTATFLVAIYNKFSSAVSRSRMRITAPAVYMVVILIFIMSSKQIQLIFSSQKQNGRGATGQITMQKEAKRVLTKYNESGSALFYFDISEITGNGQFYTEGFLVSFPYFMLFKEGKVVQSCIGEIYEDSKMLVLRNSIQIQNKVRGFTYPALCVKNTKSYTANLFFKPENFYAFKIKDKKLIDIKEDILKRLNF